MFELSSEEKNFLKALNEFQVRYLIVGLTSAVLQDAHVVTQDIDLWIEHLGSESFNKAVSSVGGFYVPPGTVGINPPMLGPGSLKVFDLVTHMHGLDTFDKEYTGSKAVQISGIPVRLLPLERIIAARKQPTGRKTRYPSQL